MSSTQELQDRIAKLEKIISKIPRHILTQYIDEHDIPSIIETPLPVSTTTQHDDAPKSLDCTPAQPVTLSTSYHDKLKNASFVASVILQTNLQNDFDKPQRLLLGSHFDAEEAKVETQAISHILCLTAKHSKTNWPSSNYLLIPWKDMHQTTSDILKESFPLWLSDVGRAHYFIDKHYKNPQAGNILVHCAIGKNRSATIMISYIMKIKMMSMVQAHKFVHNARAIHPSAHHLQQLLKLQSHMYYNNPNYAKKIVPDSAKSSIAKMVTEDLSFVFAKLPVGKKLDTIAAATDFLKNQFPTVDQLDQIYAILHAVK